MTVPCFQSIHFFIFFFCLRLLVTCASQEFPVNEHNYPNVHRQFSTFFSALIVDPLACDGVRKRKEFRDLTKRELRQWQRAVLNLTRQVDDEGFSEWDRLVILHATFVAEAHGGSYFLPWHRFFLLQLENLLRRVQPGLALPYWDWGYDANDLALSPVWGKHVAGKAVRGRPISSGPFRNLRVRFMQPHRVERNFNSNVSGAIPPVHDTARLNLIKALHEYADFADALEVCHNIVHSFIGGDMALTTLSPNDPVFYLHHAFVDYVWYKRQKVKGISDFGGTHSFGFFRLAADPSWVLRAFNRTVNESFNTSCVEYIPPSFRTWNRYIPASFSTSNVSSPCRQPNIASGLGMDTQRCMEGESVLSGLI